MLDSRIDVFCDFAPPQVVDHPRGRRHAFPHSPHTLYHNQMSNSLPLSVHTQRKLAPGLEAINARAFCPHCQHAVKPFHQIIRLPPTTTKLLFFCTSFNSLSFKGKLSIIERGRPLDEITINAQQKALKVLPVILMLNYTM